MTGFPRRHLECVSVAVLAALLLSAAPPDLSGNTLETIQTKISQYLRRPGIRSTAWGMEVIDASEDQVLLSLNPRKPFTPASVLKVLTTAAALETLGPDYRFRTGVYTNGSVSPDGTLTGDLYLVGRGDPGLSEAATGFSGGAAFEELAQAVASRGIRRVEGDIIGDDSYFPAVEQGGRWPSKDLETIHGARISALSINNNVIWVNVWPGIRKKPVNVGIEPRTSYFRIRNLAVTGSRRARRSIAIRLIPGTRTIVVSGVLPERHNYSKFVPMDRPAETAAAIYRDQLLRLGISVEGSVRTLRAGASSASPQAGLTLLAEHRSPPLIRGLEVINKQSQNLHAEMLLRTLGAEVAGSGTNEAGLDAVRRFLIEAGIEDREVSLSDGCGLSRENLLTPRFQTSLLKYLSTRPNFGLFLNTLAVSGTDGTLKHRMTAEPVRGVIYAKTGSLKGVATLSGYMITKSGRQLIFSIFANNARASAKRVRSTIDEICSLFVNLY